MFCVHVWRKLEKQFLQVWEGGVREGVGGVGGREEGEGRGREDGRGGGGKGVYGKGRG